MVDLSSDLSVYGCAGVSVMVSVEEKCFLLSTVAIVYVRSMSAIFSSRRYSISKYAIFRSVLLSCPFLRSTIANSIAESWSYPLFVLVKMP